MSEVSTPAPRSRALLATAALAVALTAADTYVVVLALEDMMSGVGLGIDQLGRATPIVSGFLLGYIAILPLIGRLSDLVSRQKVLLWCLILFSLGSVVTALSVELPIMVAGRVIQGIGGGGLVPATLALVADLIPRGRRGVALGMVSAVQEVGSVLGPLLGAAILAAWSWRAIFWINAGAGVALALLIACLSRRLPLPNEAKVRLDWRLRVVTWVGWLAGVIGAGITALALWAPEKLTSDVTYGPPFVPYEGHSSRLATPIGLWGLGALLGCIVLTAPLWWPRVRRVDMPGAVLMTLALGCVILTFAAADPSKQVVGSAGLWLLPLAAVCLAGYLVRHRLAAEPLIARGVFTRRVQVAFVVSFLVGTALVSVIVEIPVLARLTLTHSQTTAAFVLLRFLVAVPVGALIGGLLLRRFGPGIVAGLGLVLAGVGICVMAQWHAGSLKDVVLSTLVLVLAGFGVGLAIAPVNDAALAAAPESTHGLTSSLIVVGRMMGMVVGLALLTAIGLHQFSVKLESFPSASSKAVTAAGVVQVHTVLLGAGIAAFVGAVCAFAGLGRAPIQHVDHEDGVNLGL